MSESKLDSIDTVFEKMIGKLSNSRKRWVLENDKNNLEGAKKYIKGRLHDNYFKLCDASYGNEEIRLTNERNMLCGYLLDIEAQLYDIDKSLSQLLRGE